MWAWGRDFNGSFALNLPGNTMRSSPVQIPGTDWPKTFPETTKKIVKKGVYCGGAIQVT